MKPKEGFAIYNSPFFDLAVKVVLMGNFEWVMMFKISSNVNLRQVHTNQYNAVWSKDNHILELDHIWEYDTHLQNKANVFD